MRMSVDPDRNILYLFEMNIGLLSHRCRTKVRTTWKESVSENRGPTQVTESLNPKTRSPFPPGFNVANMFGLVRTFVPKTLIAKAPDRRQH